MMQLTRREMVSGAAALALVGFSGRRHALAESIVPVKLRLNWLLGGAQAPFRLGETRGYFKDAGIGIEILEGRGAGITARAVGAQSEMFGLADANAVIAAIAKGVPIRSIMAIEGVSNWAIIARADRGITKPSDLKGKIVAMTAGDAPSGMFRAVLEANGIKLDDVHRAIMDPVGKKAAIMAGKVDAFLGHASDALHILAKGVDVKVLRYADFGVVTVGTTLITHVETVKARHQHLQKFVKKSQRKWRDPK
jgi:NitT/TauT family transport system substrate-binding protein